MVQLKKGQDQLFLFLNYVKTLYVGIIHSFNSPPEDENEKIRAKTLLHRWDNNNINFII